MKAAISVFDLAYRRWPHCRRAWLALAFFGASLGAMLAPKASAATWVPTYTAPSVWVDSPTWLYGWVEGHMTVGYTIPAYDTAQWVAGHWEEEGQWVEASTEPQWVAGHWGEPQWVEGHPGEPQWVDGYEDTQWTDGHWEDSWTDGHNEDQWTDGYWDEDGNWNEGSWSTVWVDGYWSSNWVDGYSTPVWVGGYWDSSWVDGRWEDQWIEGHNEDVPVAAHWESVWVAGDYVIVTIPAQYVPPYWMDGHWGWTLSEGYWSLPVVVEGHWEGPWTWSAFTESVGDWYGESAWTPDPSTVLAPGDCAQSRPAFRNRQGGERNEAGDMRNVMALDPESGTETRTVPGTGTGPGGGPGPGGGGGGTTSQTITFPSIGTKIYGSMPFALNASASSGLAVSYTVLSGLATVSGNTITLAGVGPVMVRASQAGNTTYQAAPNRDQGFSVINPAGTGLGANGSIWHDVTGDGIRDEIIKANTPRMRVTITQIDDDIEFDVNLNWLWGNTYNSFYSYNPENPSGPPTSATFPGYRWYWLSYYTPSNPWAVAEFDFEFEPGYEYVVFGETVLGNGTVGRYGDDVARWPTAHIGGVLPRHPNQGDEQTGSRLIVREGNTLASWLNASYYAIRLGQRANGVVINAPTGPVTVTGSTTIPVIITLPESGNLIVQAKDIVGRILNGLGQKVSWRVKPVGQTSTPPWNPTSSIDLATLPPGDYDVAVKVDDDSDTHPNEVVSIRITIRPANPIFITPALSPITAPLDAGSDPSNIPDGANEFTYSNGLVSGFLDIKLKVYMRGIGSASPAEKARYKFDVDAVGGAVKVWDYGNGGGTPTINGDYLEAIVTFVGLPQNYSDFGLKFASLLREGTTLVAAPYEVFFARDGKNHPGVGQFQTPNWFYYWRQVGPTANLEYGGAPPSPGTGAEVKAMSRWKYTESFNKSLITIYDPSLGAASGYAGAQTFMSGIDFFIGIIYHEAKHVDQIGRADALLPTSGTDSFRYGWAMLSAGIHNHWRKGTDGQWGVAGVDDDGNGIIDDAKPLPPFEPGWPGSLDENLGHQDFQEWPLVWPLPSLVVPDHPIESEACIAANSAHYEHKAARSDWGNPGKNHQTLNKYDN